MRDVRFLTVFDLCELAAEIRTGNVRTKEYRRAIDEMAAAVTHLDLADAMGLMIWWAEVVEAEPPPDARRRITRL